MDMINPEKEARIRESDLLAIKDFKFIDPLHERRVSVLHVGLYKAYSMIRVLKARLCNRNLLLDNISDKNGIILGFNKAIDSAFIEYVKKEYPKITIEIENESYTFTCLVLMKTTT